MILLYRTDDTDYTDFSQIIIREIKKKDLCHLCYLCEKQLLRNRNNNLRKHSKHYQRRQP